MGYGRNVGVVERGATEGERVELSRQLRSAVFGTAPVASYRVALPVLTRSDLKVDMIATARSGAWEKVSVPHV